MWIYGLLQIYEEDNIEVLVMLMKNFTDGIVLLFCNPPPLLYLQCQVVATRCQPDWMIGVLFLSYKGAVTGLSLTLVCFFLQSPAYLPANGRVLGLPKYLH